MIIVPLRSWRFGFDRLNFVVRISAPPRVKRVISESLRIECENEFEILSTEDYTEFEEGDSLLLLAKKK